MSIRQMKTLLLEIVIPCFLMVAGLALVNIPFFVDPEGIPVTNSDLPKGQSLYFGIMDNVDQIQASALL